MSKVLVVGDMHGNWRAMRGAIGRAQEEKITRIIQVGDFGIWPGEGGVKYLDLLDDFAEKAGVTIYFVDGNHEDFDQIDHMVQTVKPNEDGHVPFRENVLYIPRGTIWEWYGKVFMGMGGAASIDKDWREPHVSWWPQELITQGDLYKAMDNFLTHGKIVDYMFTHDCSDKTPWGFTLIPDPRSLVNRRVLDWLLSSIRPRMQFHGHMHKFFDWELKHENGYVTKVYGLNLEAERHAMGILDTETNEFSVVPWKMPRDSVL